MNDRRNLRVSRWTNSAGFSRTLLSALWACSIMACSDPGTKTAPQSPSTMFWALELNHRAINLAMVAPYDTITLTATPKNVFGEVLASAQPAQLVALTDHVVVYPDGMVKGWKQTSASGVLVIATMSLNGVTRSDTARVVVTNIAAPSRMTSFRMQLPVGDSAILPASHLLYEPSAKRFSLRALDTAANPISRVIARFDVVDSRIGQISGTSSGSFVGLMPGTTRIRASASVYGVSMTDSVDITVIDRSIAAFWVKGNTGNEREVVIRSGGEVFWINMSDDSLDIVFEDPAAGSKTCCTSLGIFGDTSDNIAPFKRNLSLPIVMPGILPLARTGTDNVRGRRFVTPGTYTYRSTKLPNVWGTIVVH